MQYSASTSQSAHLPLTRKPSTWRRWEFVHPPFLVTPFTASLSHIWKYPRLHALHVPSCPPCHGPPTRSPSFQRFSFGPTATTVPMTSWPGITGNLALRDISAHGLFLLFASLRSFLLREFLVQCAAPRYAWGLRLTLVRSVPAAAQSLNGTLRTREL